MRKYVCAYFSWLESLKKCTDEQFGKLIRAALRYARDGTEPDFPEGSPEELIWGLMRSQLDIDSDRYQKKVAASKAGNDKRWGKPEKTIQTGEAEIASLKAFRDSMPSTNSR